ncbi:MAG: hypothetical protein WCT27_00020 [Patescibacteria group bacterium]
MIAKETPAVFDWQQLGIFTGKPETSSRRRFKVNLATFVATFALVVKKIVTHFAPHLDELLAAIIVRMYGKDALPGIETAPIEVRKGNTSVRMDPTEYLRQYGHLMIGCGEWQLDEHGDGNEAVCAADLVARELGVKNNPKLKRLLDFVRREDLEGHTTALDLAQCVKVMNFHAKRRQPKHMEAWLATVIHLYLSDDTTFPIVDPKCRVLPQLYARWLDENHFKSTDPNLKHLTRLVNVLAKQPASILFDAAECTALLCAHHPDGQEAAYRWLVPMFEAFMAKQADFLLSVTALECQKTEILRPQPRSHISECWQVVTVPRQFNNGDLKSLNAAARYLYRYLDFLIVQRPNSATSILQQKAFSGDMLRMIARGIRLEEQIAEGIPSDELTDDFDTLGAPRRLDCASRWYLFINEHNNGGALFNAAFTQPEIKPTSIILEDIANVIHDIILRVVRTGATESTWSHYVLQRRNRLDRECTAKPGCNKLGDVVKFA